MTGFHLEIGYQPGLIADVIRLHMAYYAPAWGFGRPFEVKLAGDMAAFYDRYDPQCDVTVRALDDSGRLIGAITLDGGADPELAQLRWFIVDGVRQGRGLGRALMQSVHDFADANGRSPIFLTTFPGLTAARRLYEAFGYRLTERAEKDPWSGAVGFERYERRLNPRPARASGC